MFRFSLAFAIGLWLAGNASAASWAESMFDELVMDFGTVPRGPMLSHAFRMTNNTQNTVHVAGVRVSCGCTSASALKQDLAPGESTAIQAQMDTHRFLGHKAVTIYVQLDQPQWEEVRLLVQANSRDDMSVTPESLALGQVKRGTSPAAAVQVTFLGNDRWTITDATADSNYVQPAIKEIRRENNEVVFQVSARLRRDTPVGKWYTDVWLKTNNESMPRIRVPLTVEVEPALSITPSPLVLQLKKGETVEKRVMVRGSQPFRITGFKGADGRLSVKNPPTDSKTTHILTLTLTGTTAGPFEKSIQVQTDLKGEGPIELRAHGTVTP